MIQFNLLPDVKIAYIKAQRQKRVVMVISFIASGAAIALFLMLILFVHGVQKKSINDLTGDIKQQGQELTDTPNLNRMLTVQNQLKELESLHGNKVVTSRLFAYLQKVTPTNVGISNFKIDFAANTMEISGEAPSVAAINAYADSLKYARFTTRDNNEEQPAFSSVVLASLGVSNQKNPQYTLRMSYDAGLFAQDQEIELTVKKAPVNATADSTLPSIFDESRGGQ